MGFSCRNIMCGTSSLMLLDVPMLPHWGEDRTFFMPSRWGGSVFPDAADAVPQLGQCIFWESAVDTIQQIFSCNFTNLSNNFYYKFKLEIKSQISLYTSSSKSGYCSRTLLTHSGP